MSESIFRLSILMHLTFVILIPMCYGIDLSPALIWGGGGSSGAKIFDVNPLGRTSESEFQNTINQRIGPEHPPTLVFIKDKLCIEDFTQNSRDLKELINTGSFQHFPAVEAPITAFDKLSLYNQSMEEKPSSISNGQLIFTSAVDFSTISNIYKNLKESNPNLIAALIGKSCSYSKSERRKRSTDVGGKKSTDSFIFPGHKFTSRMLLYAEDAITLEKVDAKSKKSQIFNLTMANLETASDSGAGNTSSSFVVNMAFNIEDKPTFKFYLSVDHPKYYSLKKIKYLKNGNDPEIILTPSNQIDIPFNYSYHCTPNVIFKNHTHGISLSFKNIQIQVDAVKFGEAFDCIGFMSIPILSVIFVILILALIMIWGLMFIMDIRTMDRFDDPKAKTITISAQE